MTKYRIKAVTYANGSTKYYVQEKGWFLWHNVEKSIWLSCASFTTEVSFKTLKEAENYIVEKKANELRHYLANKEVAVCIIAE